MASSMNDDAKARAAKFLETGEFSDIRIVCGGHEFKAHKITLLFKKSHFFEAALRGNFAESNSPEIEIKDQDPAIVARMLCWFYTDEIMRRLDENSPWSIPDPYTTALKDGNSDTELWLCKLAVALYAIASQFGVPGLQQAACKMFESQFCAGPEGRSKMWNKDPVDVKDLIRSVYTTTSEVEHGLRDIVVKSILQDRPKNRLFYGKTDKIIRSIPEFAMDVATCFVDVGYDQSNNQYQDLVRPSGAKGLEHCKNYPHDEKPSTSAYSSDKLLVVPRTTAVSFGRSLF